MAANEGGSAFASTGGDSSAGALLLRVAPDDTVIYASRSLAAYLGLEKEMLEGCPIETLESLCTGELKECFRRPETGRRLNALVTDGAGRVFEAKTWSEAGFFDLVLDEVTSAEAVINPLRGTAGVDVDSLSQEELDSLRRPDRRVLTVVVFFMHGLQSLSERLPPLEIRLLLAQFHEDAGDAVRERGGTISAGSEERILGIFGAPRAFADHAGRGIEAARNYLAGYERARKKFRKAGKELPAISCGIATGEAVAGVFRTGERLRFTAIGAAANTARALALLARPGEIVVTDSCANFFLSSLPPEWSAVAEYSESYPNLEGLSWSGQEVQALPSGYERKVIRCGPPDVLGENNAAVSFEYLWAYQPASSSEPEPVARLALPQKSRRISLPLQERPVASSIVQNFGKYRLLKVLGAGGMGKVWLAQDRFGNQLAIKTLHGPETASEGGVRRFQREAEIMSRLPHRNICRIFETGESEGIPYLAMEFVDGVTLSDLLVVEEAGEEIEVADAAAAEPSRPPKKRRRRASRRASAPPAPRPAIPHGAVDLRLLIRDARSRMDARKAKAGAAATSSVAGEPGAPAPVRTHHRLLPLEQTFSIFLKVCEAVQFAHEHGVLHRDLKPGNILLREDGEPLVADFGLAKIQDADATRSLSVSGNVLGTLANMAPEQAESSKNVDERADVYALGTILYLMVTGARHFTPTGNFFADAQTLQTYEAPSARSVNPAVDHDLDVILRKCLQPRPVDRYRNVAALQNDLVRYRNGEPISARKMSGVEVFARWIGRNRAVAALSGCFLFLMLAGTVVAFLEVSHRARVAEAALAEAQTARAEAESSRAEALDSEERAGEKAFEADRRADEARKALEERDEATRLQALKEEEVQKADKARLEARTALAEEKLRKEELEKQVAATGKLLEYTTKQLEAARAGILAAAETTPAPDPHAPVENSLGMMFVTLPALGIDFSTHETRVRDFQEYLKETQGSTVSFRYGGIPESPASNLSYEDAIGFCKWLSEKEGRGYRLPTKAEWEAALTLEGGVPPRYPWGDSWPPKNRTANMHQALLLDPMPDLSKVAFFDSNPLGIYDMAGNVREWIGDAGDDSLDLRALKGGSFRDASPRLFESTFEVLAPATLRHPTFGFRVVRETSKTDAASPGPGASQESQTQ